MPLSLNSTRELLHKLEHKPVKNLGQNFLIDGNIVDKSINLAKISMGNSVVEIGPGLGTLTQAILKTGACLWVVERDAKLARYIRDQFTINENKIRLIEGNCLDYPLAGLPTKLAASSYKIVANLPYAISTPWIDSVLSGQLPERMVLMLQKEAADRYIASHGDKNFGAISIILQSAFSINSKNPVSARCFYPTPKVDSVLIRLDRRQNSIRFSTSARLFMRRIFTQRRKQLGKICKTDTQVGALKWFHNLLDLGIHPKIRAEELAIENWQKLKDYT